MPFGEAAIPPALLLLDFYPDYLVASVILACYSLGADSTCDFTSSIWILATGTAGLMLYEPISSQINRLVGMETASFENLACTFADGLVPTTPPPGSFFPTAGVLYCSQKMLMQV